MIKDKQALEGGRISILGARVHNLKNIDVEIPRNKLTVTVSYTHLVIGGSTSLLVLQASLKLTAASNSSLWSCKISFSYSEIRGMNSRSLIIDCKRANSLEADNLDSSSLMNKACIPDILFA